MKQFKHKPSGKIAKKEVGAYVVDNYFLPDWLIEKSNDWEEVVEKEYEILSVIDANNEVWRKEKGGNSYFKGSLWVLLESFGQNWRIHSVKRVSDGEVFTIGELVDFDDEENHKITSFGDLQTNNFWAFFNDKKQYGSNLSGIKKIKQPLFVTEDGVEIYKNQKYFGLYTGSWLIEEHENGIDYDINPEDVADSSYLTFSSKEKVEEYILENKPCLSIKDLMILNFTSLQLREIREIAKSKIQ